VGGVGEVPQAGTGSGAVPVDEDPAVVAADEVPRGEVVVADEVLAVGRDDDVPVRVGRVEVCEGVVQVADQAAGSV